MKTLIDVKSGGAPCTAADTHTYDSNLDGSEAYTFDPKTCKMVSQIFEASADTTACNLYEVIGEAFWNDVGCETEDFTGGMADEQSNILNAMVANVFEKVWPLAELAQQKFADDVRLMVRAHFAEALQEVSGRSGSSYPKLGGAQ